MGEAVWGPEIAHDGAGNPLPDGTYVWVRLADGMEAEGVVQKRPSRFGEVDVWDWSVCDAWGLPHWKLIVYRVRQFAALTELKELVADPYSVPASRELVPA